MFSVMINPRVVKSKGWEGVNILFSLKVRGTVTILDAVDQTYCKRKADQNCSSINPSGLFIASHNSHPLLH